MKKILLSLLLCIVTSLFAFTQVTKVSVDSEKQYENNTKTAYLTLHGYYDTDLLDGISRQLNSHPDISLFSFYDNANKTKCMYTANAGLSKTILIDLINDFLSDYYEFDHSNDLPNTEYFEDAKEVKFEVSGIKDDDHKAQIILELSKFGFVNAIKINEQGICKISISKTTRGASIKTAFNDLHLEIIENNTP